MYIWGIPSSPRALRPLWWMSSRDGWTQRAVRFVATSQRVPPLKLLSQCLQYPPQALKRWVDWLLSFPLLFLVHFYFTRLFGQSKHFFFFSTIRMKKNSLRLKIASLIKSRQTVVFTRSKLIWCTLMRIFFKRKRIFLVGKNDFQLPPRSGIVHNLAIILTH